MNYLYPFFIAFFIVFMSELGDKTQLLVLSFSTKLKLLTIILGVALGSFFSHGIAILFGGFLGGFDNVWFHMILKFVTYISFLFFGIVTLKNISFDNSSNKNGFLQKISNLKIGYIFIIAFSIAVGELGDKTFLASLGLGTQYPNLKLVLVLGAVLGMVISDFIAILFGKFLSNTLSTKMINTLSGFIFIIFGLFGLISFLFANFSYFVYNMSIF